MSIRPESIFEIVPYLSVQDANEAIQFYTAVFGAAPFSKLDLPDGRVMHCEFRLGNVRFYLSDDLPEHGGVPNPKKMGGTTMALHIYVKDCDALVREMEIAGGTILMAPTDTFWGERFGRVRDPFGHEWGISTIIAEMSPDEIQSAAQKALAEISPQTND